MEQPKLSKKIYAKDYKCCVCKEKQAVTFWPCIDPDIKAHPFCNECLRKEQIELAGSKCINLKPKE